MIPNPALALDQIGDAPRRPQARVVPEGFWAAREPALDASEIGRRQAWLAPGASGFLQRRPAPAFELLRPAAYRLTMDTNLSRDIRLGHALLQQLRRLQSSRFQRIEIPAHPGWIPHASNGSRR